MHKITAVIYLAPETFLYVLALVFFLFSFLLPVCEHVGFEVSISFYYWVISEYY